MRLHTPHEFQLTFPKDSVANPSVSKTRTFLLSEQLLTFVPYSKLDRRHDLPPVIRTPHSFSPQPLGTGDWVTNKGTPTLQEASNPLQRQPHTTATWHYVLMFTVVTSQGHQLFPQSFDAGITLLGKLRKQTATPKV